jgi:hypothetical protein
MVAAGVYLVARMYGFYALSPTALSIVALVGGFTALFAATMALVKREIKQVLAYSTVSQYGYIMLGLGAGGYVAGVFHLTTHAFFKALLFLGAGSVIIAMHHNENMWDMGGLKDRMPVTYYTFLAGSLALAGIVPFAGFWSKDEVLYEALVHGLGGSPILLVAYALGLVAVFFTGFYTFRMVLLTFHGEPRTETAEDPHPVRWNVKLPLVVLGILATVAGFINMVPVEELTGAHLAYLHDWLDAGVGGVTAHHYGDLLSEFAGYSSAELGSLLPALLSLGIALAGAGLAWTLYSGTDPEEHTARLGALQRLFVHNYYQDEYQVWLATGVTQPVSRIADKFDQGVVDGVVNGVSSASLLSGRRIRRVQSGLVTNYALLLALGLLSYRYRAHIQFPGAAIVYKWQELKGFFKVNLDIFLRTLSLIFAFTFFTAQSSRLGSDILAVNTMFLQMLAIASYGIDGFAFAAESLTGRFKGMGDPARLKKLIRHLFAWGFALAVLLSGSYLLFSGSIIRFFTHHDHLVALARSFTIWIVLAPLTNSFAYLWDGIYVGATASRPMRNAMFVATFLLYVPLYYILNVWMGNHGLWLAFTIFMMARGASLWVIPGKYILNTDVGR